MELSATSIADLVRSECRTRGYNYFDGGDFDLNLFGVRNFSRTSNTFDDLIGCLWREKREQKVLLVPATVDPGLTHRRAPPRPEGVAHLKEQQARGLWEIGLHRGVYPALVQVGRAEVFRDNNRDEVIDLEGPTTTDVSGLNLHHAGENSSYVNNWSAVCQVTKRKTDHDRIMHLARLQVATHAWRTFTYTLYDVVGSPRLHALLLAVRDAG